MTDTVDWSRLEYRFGRGRDLPPQRRDQSPDPDQAALVDSLEASLFDAVDEPLEPPAEWPEWRGVRPWTRRPDE